MIGPKLCTLAFLIPRKEDPAHTHVGPNLGPFAETGDGQPDAEQDGSTRYHLFWIKCCLRDRTEQEAWDHFHKMHFQMILALTFGPC